MIALLVAGALLAAPQETTGATASEYFPLKARMQMMYSEKSLQNAMTKDVIGEPVQVSGETAVPVITFQNDQKINATYYRVSGDSVMVVAYDVASPLPKPMPVLMMPPARGTRKWEFEGPASSDKVAEPVIMRAQSQFKGEREVLGKKVPVLEVRITASVGGGKAKEEVEQVSIYGKGIGLIETTSTTRIARQRATSVIRLIRIEEPQGGL